MKLPDENNIRIIETVTDDYGTARKFSDGTMIVTQTYTSSFSSMNAWGVLYSHTLDTPPSYPVEFAELPVVSLTAKPLGTYNAFISSHSDAGSTKCSPLVDLLRPSTVSAEAKFEIDVIAIGKWK